MRLLIMKQVVASEARSIQIDRRHHVNMGRLSVAATFTVDPLPSIGSRSLRSGRREFA